MPKRSKLKLRPFAKENIIAKFKLVHRSQRDPLIADESAPQHVLVPEDTERKEKRKREQQDCGIYYDDDYNYMQHLKKADEGTPDADFSFRIHAEQQAKRDFTDSLPAEVFPSKMESDVGMLNRAVFQGFQPHLSDDIKDVLAALDENVVREEPNEDMVEDSIEMDSILQLMGNPMNEDGVSTPVESDEEFDSDGDSEDEKDVPEHLVRYLQGQMSAKTLGRGNDSYEAEGSSYDEDDEESIQPLEDVGNCIRKVGNRRWTREDVKSHGSSLSSAHLPRNENLQTFDKIFDRVLEDEYGEGDIGHVSESDDSDEEEGRFEKLEGDMEESLQKDLHRCMKKERIRSAVEPLEEDLKERLLSICEEEETFKKSDFEWIVSDKKRLNYDVESILTCGSKSSFTPTVIKPSFKQRNSSSISSNGIAPVELNQFGIAVNTLKSRSMTKRHVMEDERQVSGLVLELPVCNIRPTNETAEEKTSRKATVKEVRKIRRLEKKLNRLAFERENKLQQKQVANAKHTVTV